jgi:hypothetical protein
MTLGRYLLIVVLAFTLLVVLPVQCYGQEHKVDGVLPPDPWVQVPMPDIYPGLWAVNQACMDKTYAYGGDGAGTVKPQAYTTVEQIKWYVAGTEWFTDRQGRALYGMFVKPDTIVLAGMKLFDTRLVRHEMLHAMGVSYHPLIPFHTCGLFDGLHGGSQRGK